MTSRRNGSDPVRIGLAGSPRTDLAARARLYLRRPPGEIEPGRTTGGLAEALADAPADPRLPHQDRGRPGSPARPCPPRPGRKPWRRTRVKCSTCRSSTSAGSRPSGDLRPARDRRRRRRRPKNQPVYFHCHHGSTASMVQMAYRMNLLQLDLERASDEIERDFGWSRPPEAPITATWRSSTASASCPSDGLRARPAPETASSTRPSLVK